MKIRNDIKCPIYLDMNILIELQKNNDLYSKTMAFISKHNYSVVYSAAHLEELRVRYMGDKQEGTEYINFINLITGGLAIRGLYKNEPLFIIEENAKYCMARVLVDDGCVATDNVEKYDYNYILFQREVLHDDKVAVRIGNLPPNDVFYDESIQKILRIDIDVLYALFKNDGFCINDKYRELKYKSFQILEAYIELLMKILNIIGYRADKKSCLRHSSTHDISHVHYASKTKAFITNDKKLIDKAKAVYSYLAIPTKVCSFEEFIRV